MILIKLIYYSFFPEFCFFDKNYVSNCNIFENASFLQMPNAYYRNKIPIGTCFWFCHITLKLPTPMIVMAMCYRRKFPQRTGLILNVQISKAYI